MNREYLMSRRRFLETSGILTLATLFNLVGSEAKESEIEPASRIPVVITGFEPFQGRPVNTSTEIAQNFHHQMDPHHFLLTDLAVDNSNYYTASDFLIREIESGSLAEAFQNGGIVIMLGETESNVALVRIEQVSQLRGSDKLGIPSDLYEQIMFELAKYAQEQQVVPDALITSPYTRDAVGNYVCGATFFALLEYSLSHPEKKILPIFIHVPVAKNLETDLRTYRILEIVQQVMRNYFLDHQHDQPFPVFAQNFPHS